MINVSRLRALYEELTEKKHNTSSVDGKPTIESRYTSYKAFVQEVEQRMTRLQQGELLDFDKDKELLERLFLKDNPVSSMGSTPTSHADLRNLLEKSELLELIQDVMLEPSEKTWENLRHGGKSLIKQENKMVDQPLRFNRICAATTLNLAPIPSEHNLKKLREYLSLNKILDFSNIGTNWYTTNNFIVSQIYDVFKDEVSKENLDKYWINFFIWLIYSEKVSIQENQINLDDKKDSSMNKSEKDDVNQPLNQILYGPPGTGKTYKTTELGVQIADPEWYVSLTEVDTIKRHKAIKEKYDELIQKNQIAFTTFHQSFSYEDFIEGLKAYVPEGQTNIAYKVEDGIFKRIAIAATKSQGIHQIDIGLNQEPRIWKISLGERWETERRKKYFEIGQARIGWSNVGDLREEHSEKEQLYYDSLKSNTHSTLYDFSSRMKMGDVVLCLKDQQTIQAIGVVKSDYYYDAIDEDDYAHVRDINWIATNISLNILDLNDQKNLTLKTVYELYRISWSNILEELKKQDIEIEDLSTSEITLDQNHNYVLVMDEINRGNISKIFGELITLIEDDKRAGKSDARELTLPYSKEPFTVPSNLYLIGTMNTADKSLTQLDLALRRRFEFKEIGPDHQILEDMEASQHDVNIPLMLRKMNQRIQYLKGKDYQIGHSYFMPLCSEMDQAEYLQTLRRIFKNKIIPLLQEYFFSNLKHIGLVLNDNPDDMDERKIIQDLNFDENIFGYGQQPKGNPLFAVELNLDCFTDLKRFQQIYQ